MPRYREKITSDHSVEEIFSLVMDVESYPGFLPWVKAVEIEERHLSYLIANVTAEFKHITQSYRCHVSWRPVDEANDTAHIDVEMIEGPFTHLVNYWRIRPRNAAAGTAIEFAIDFAFTSRTLNTLIGGVFLKAQKKLLTAFQEEAGKRFS